LGGKAVKSTQQWLVEVTELLEECVHTKKQSSLGSLQDHMRQMNLPSALKAIGCDESCTACDWGVPSPHPLQNPCRLGAFQEAILGMDPGDKLSASLQREARDLLVALLTKPSPKKP
jgi:hypothetical protein